MEDDDGAEARRDAASNSRNDDDGDACAGRKGGGGGGGDGGGVGGGMREEVERAALVVPAATPAPVRCGATTRDIIAQCECAAMDAVGCDGGGNLAGGGGIVSFVLSRCPAAKEFRRTGRTRCGRMEGGDGWEAEDRIGGGG
jgi:hypothetical protein